MRGAAIAWRCGIGEPAAGAHTPWESLLAFRRPDVPEVRREPDDLTIVVYTSGTSEAALIAAARERIASYKKPTEVRFVDHLSRTASRKIDKPALRAEWANVKGQR